MLKHFCVLSAHHFAGKPGTTPISFQVVSTGPTVAVCRSARQCWLLMLC